MFRRLPFRIVSRQAPPAPVPISSLRSIHSAFPLRKTPRDPVDPSANEGTDQSQHLHHKAAGAPEPGAGNAAEEPTLPSKRNEDPDHYAKDDHTIDPVPHGTTTYVVSHPEHDAPYDIPSGAFPTSEPYAELQPTSRPSPGEPSSTSTSSAHPTTTARADKVEGGEGSSSAVRHTEAPGEMGQGSRGGMELQEGVKVTKGEGPGLAQRNPWPSEEMGKKGLKEAWKERK